MLDRQQRNKFMERLKDTWKSQVEKNQDVHPMTTMFNIISAYDNVKGTDFINYVGYQSTLSASSQLFQQMDAHGLDPDEFFYIVEAELGNGENSPS